MANKHSKHRHTITRRFFLKLFSASLIGGQLAACTHKKFFNPDENILLSGGDFADGNTTQNALLIINLTQKEKRIIETAFLPHGIYINPGNKYSIFCIEKNGHNACEIDLQTQKVKQIFHSTKQQIFSGHAAFSQDGKKIYCVESNLNNKQGSISIRDSKTLETIKQLPTLGLSPHDCQLTNGNVLTVSNTGKSESGFHQPSLVSIDLNTEKLIERIKLESNG
ncbi:MAG: YncE family protein, partial [Gammaproteobacteria bacterium]